MIEVKRITPAEGYTLYNGEVLSKEVYLGCNDRADNWWEITDEEAAAIYAEMEKAMDPLMDDPAMVEETTEKTSWIRRLLKWD